MFVHSHGFVDHDAIKSAFASISTECPMQLDRIIQHVNKDLLPRGVSVFIVDTTKHVCMWANMEVVPQLYNNETLAVSNMCTSGGSVEGGLPQQVRLNPHSIKQPFPFLVDMLLGEMKLANKTLPAQAVLHTANWNGGRCVFISDKTDAQFALDRQSETPPFLVLLTRESFGRPRRRGRQRGPRPGASGAGPD